METKSRQLRTAPNTWQAGILTQGRNRKSSPEARHPNRADLVRRLLRAYLMSPSRTLAVDHPDGSARGQGLEDRREGYSHSAAHSRVSCGDVVGTVNFNLLSQATPAQGGASPHVRHRLVGREPAPYQRSLAEGWVVGQDRQDTQPTSMVVPKVRPRSSLGPAGQVYDTGRGALRTSSYTPATQWSTEAPEDVSSAQAQGTAR